MLDFGSDDIPLPDTFSHKLTSTTELLNLKLYVVILIVLALLLGAFLIAFLCLRACGGSHRREHVKLSSGSIPLVSKEIPAIKEQPRPDPPPPPSASEGKMGNKKLKEAAPPQPTETSVDVESGRSGEGDDVLGWGRWYSLRELENATRGFSPENVIGEGGYGVVY